MAETVPRNVGTTEATNIRGFEMVTCGLVTWCGRNPIEDVNTDISSRLDAFL